MGVKIRRIKKRLGSLKARIFGGGGRISSPAEVKKAIGREQLARGMARRTKAPLRNQKG